VVRVHVEREVHYCALELEPLETVFFSGRGHHSKERKTLVEVLRMKDLYLSGADVNMKILSRSQDLPMDVYSERNLLFQKRINSKHRQPLMHVPQNGLNGARILPREANESRRNYHSRGRYPKV
jgi:hypothetical protein